MQNITQKYFNTAEDKLNELLTIVTQKVGFDRLTKTESLKFEKYKQIVGEYEEHNFIIPMPETIQGLLDLKMYENKRK